MARLAVHRRLGGLARHTWHTWRARLARGAAGGSPPPPEALDPLVGRALALLQHPPAPPSGRLSVEDVAEQLLRDELLASGWLEVGIWGQPVMRNAALAAARLHTVALNGDESAPAA